MEISIPENFTETIGTNSSTLLNNLSGVVSIIIGILLAFFVISIVMDVLQQKKDDDSIK